MDASYKIQRGIHVHLIQFFMCPEFWVHITEGLRSCVFYLTLTNIVYHSLCEHLIINPCGGRFVSAIWICTKKRPEAVMIMKLGVE